MRHLSSKKNREAVLCAIKERKTLNGFSLETYKGLQFFVKEEGGKFFLECYKDNSTKPILNFYYTDKTQMQKRIEQTKQNYDLSQQYKAKRKAEQSGRLTGAAACADAIRAELKAAFPSVKFSVRSETFSGGDAVRISWEDGATVAEVEAITSKYQSGYFNGMDDIYEYTNTRTDLPQVKYITESRTMSEASTIILKPLAEQLFISFGDGDHYNCRDANQFLHRIFYNTSFLNVGAPLAIVPTGETCGINTPELFYKIQFKKTEQPKEVEPVTISSDSVAIVEYGKGLAVVGNTKPIKDDLKALGGRFNFRLTCGAGWVFPMSKLEELKKILTKPQKAETLENVESFSFFDEVLKSLEA